MRACVYACMCMFVCVCACACIEYHKFSDIISIKAQTNGSFQMNDPNILFNIRRQYFLSGKMTISVHCNDHKLAK